MSFNLTYDPKHGIILCAYAGHVTADGFREGTEKILSLAKKHKTNLLLIDDSKLASAVSIMEIYEMPRFYDEVEGNRKSRIALILPPSGQIREDVLFYETVCQNRGWNVKAFDTHSEAIDWLLPKPAPNMPDAGDA